ATEATLTILIFIQTLCSHKQSLICIKDSSRQSPEQMLTWSLILIFRPLPTQQHFTCPPWSRVEVVSILHGAEGHKCGGFANPDQHRTGRNDALPNLVGQGGKCSVRS